MSGIYFPLLEFFSQTFILAGEFSKTFTIRGGYEIRQRIRPRFHTLIATQSVLGRGMQQQQGVVVIPLLRLLGVGRQAC